MSKPALTTRSVDQFTGNQLGSESHPDYISGLDEYGMELSYSTDLYDWGLWMEMHRFVAEANLQAIVRISN